MDLTKILAEYNENNKKAASSGGKAFDLSKYFSTYLPKGTDEAIKTIRLLPGKDGASPFSTIHMHTKKVGQDWKKFICPKHEKDEDCAFCEAYDLLNTKGNEEQRKTAYTYKARQAYVMKLIDRDNEADGPKFWRVNHNTKKNGYYDSIISLFKLYALDLSDPTIGRDLSISIERNEKGIPVVTNIIAREPSPLSADKDRATTWLSDEDSWENVYSIKPYDYLKLLVMGKEPVWDSTSKSFIAKDDGSEPKPSQKFDGDLKDELTLGGAKPTATATPVKEETPVAPTTDPTTVPTTTPITPVTPTTPVADDDDDDEDDLPF